jgi:hypothetical protein
VRQVGAPTIAATPLILAGAGAPAGLLRANSASRIDPMKAMRCE